MNSEALWNKIPQLEVLIVDVKEWIYGEDRFFLCEY